VTDHAAEEKIRAARGRLAFLRPYFDRAIYSHVLIEEPRVPTVGVDRYRRLYYNPRFVHALEINQLVTCLMHELGHSLREHHRRADAMGVSPATAHIANVAQDAAINYSLRDEVNQHSDMPHLPGFAIYPEKLELEEGKVWETYYMELLNKMPPIKVLLPGGGFPEGGGPGSIISPDCGSGSHGVQREWEHGDPGMQGSHEGVSDADWSEIREMTAEQISARQKSRGDVPGGWVSWANSILRPRRIPWDHELAGGIRQGIADTAGMVIHTYRKPSRRASSLPDVIQPAMRKPKPFVCVVGDTSGSMDEQHDLALVRGVVQDVAQAMGARLAFLATDAQVHGGVQHVTDGRSIELKGRGGTNMVVGIEYAATKLRPRPDVIVVVTDCGTGWPAKPPRNTRVIVCAVGNDEHSIAQVPKWARLIRVDPTTTSSSRRPA
jgi:predicted metal-dependent peptidase